MLHLEQLRTEIVALGEHAISQQRGQQESCKEARARLVSAPSTAELRELAAQYSDREACALPATDVPLGQRLATDAVPQRETTVIAVDGSQIMPDRHGPVLYYLIQVGGLIFRYNGTAPTSHREAELFFNEADLYDNDGQIIGRQLGMRRTVAELQFLAKLTTETKIAGTPDPALALVDGPLLWPYSRRSDEEQTLLPRYMTALNQFQETGAMPAGFVERPGGRPLLNLLNLIPAPSTDRKSIPAAGIRLTDRMLMEIYLAPGERTVWLTRQSAMNQQHARHGHKIWFYYLNVGTPGYPVIARVEAPAWAASNARWSAKLHSVLIHQAQILHGYPYVLARAHEVALVTQEDKVALDNLLQRRLMEAGLETRPSEKARQKTYLGRRR